MKMRFRGSHTIEATFVMAVVFWVMVALIQFGFGIHDKTVGAMVLQETMEKARQDEDKWQMSDFAAKGRERAGRPFSFPAYNLTLYKAGDFIKGKGYGGKWGMEIQMNVFDPEKFLRMSTLID